MLIGNGIRREPGFGRNNTHLHFILIQEAFIQDRKNWIKCACLLKAGELCLQEQRKCKLAVYSTVACTHILKLAAVLDTAHPTDASAHRALGVQMRTIGA